MGGGKKVIRQKKSSDRPTFVSMIENQSIKDITSVDYETFSKNVESYMESARKTDEALKELLKSIRYGRYVTTKAALREILENLQKYLESIGVPDAKAGLDSMIIAWGGKNPWEAK